MLFCRKQFEMLHITCKCCNMSLRLFVIVTWMVNQPCLTQWGWVTHICISTLNIIGSDNGLSLGQHQDIIWTNTGILLIWTLETHLSENLIAIHAFSFKKMPLKKLSGKWQPICPGLSVLMPWLGTKQATNCCLKYWYVKSAMRLWSTIRYNYMPS